MGQIANEKSVINRANIRQLADTSASGLANYVPATGEVILISSDNSMSSAGQGNFDSYIEGDGTTAARYLPIHCERNELLKRQVPAMTMAAAGMGNNWETKLTIDGTGLVTSSGATNTTYVVSYFTKPMAKGSVVHFDGRNTNNRTMKLGWTRTDPSTLNSLEGLQLDAYYAFAGNEHSYDLTAPYDGAYLVYYYYNRDWVSGSIVFTFYLSDYLKSHNESVDGSIGELEEGMSSKLNIVQMNRTDEVYWTVDASTSVNTGTTISNGGKADGDGLITIVVNATKSGWRFGMYLGYLPIGKYKIEFDLSGARLDGGTGYQNSSTTQTGNVTTRKWGEHCVLNIEKNNNTLNYYHFATQTVGTGTYVISNFSVIRLEDELTEWVSETNNNIAENAVGLTALQIAALDAGCVGYKNVTLVPSAAETYNAYVRINTSPAVQVHSSSTSGNNNQAANRLTYFPEQILVGNQEVTIKYTGLNTLNVYQLPYKPLGSSPVKLYTNDEFFAVDTLVFDSKANTVFKEEQDENGIRTVHFITDKSCRRLAIVMGATQAVGTSPKDITNNITEITLPVADFSKIDFTVFSTDSLSKYIEKIAQAKFVAGGSTAVTASSLGLLHYSDIHGDDVATEVIKKIASEAHDYIDDVICTGDSVLYYADDNARDNDGKGINWWKASGLAEKSLFVLGNHDAATPAATEYDMNENTAAWNGKGQVWSYENYFKDYAAGWGVTRPTDNDATDHPACYWHKDYTAQKIRMIGLDCMNRFDGTVDPQTGEILTAGFKHLTNEQELWLIARLNETLDSENAAYGYSVVFLCHYPLDWFSGDNETWDDTTHRFVYNQNAAGGRVMSYKTGVPVNFHYEKSTSYDHSASNTNWHKFNMNNRVENARGVGGYNPGNYNNVAEIIKAWKNNGGKYVVWLCGHTHADYMWYAANFPDMLCIVINQAGCLRGTTVGARDTDMESRTCANFVSIDTQNGVIKLVRIGFSLDKWMNSHRYLCYDYVNRVVLNEG